MASTSNLGKSIPDTSIINSSIEQRNPWSPQTDHAENDPDVKENSVLQTLPLHSPPSSSSPPTARPPLPTPPSFDPTSRAGISLRAFLLGIAFGISLPSIFLLLAIYQSLLWRLPFFLLTLSLFHFLEYYITARFNPAAATISAFLLSQNGSAYNIAHTLAFLECAVHCYFFPWSLGGAAGERGTGFARSYFDVGLAIGLIFIVGGQVVRSMAMVQAGTNFNHLVQSKKKQGHVLVTSGIYAWLRHPSYFGFWWWGLGTQLALGNVLCLVGYAAALWRFFSKRIEGEEELLVDFFGEEYSQYRARTRVGIPFIP